MEQTAVEPTHERRMTIGLNDVTVTKRVAGGYTSEVYKGRLHQDGGDRDVAVKVMQDIGMSNQRRLFEEEALNLAKLKFFEEQDPRFANGRILAGHRVVSETFGKGEIDGKPAIVMEWIDGEPMSKVERKQGKFSEGDALTLGYQLFRTLHLMHTGLKKTYIDLKYENLWLTRDPNGLPALKMTDFGTVEDPTPRGVNRDITLGGVYLMKMLTGYTPSISLGTLLENVVPRIQRDESLSFGAKRLLVRLLHPNPDQRPQSANEVTNELYAMTAWWQAQPEKLVEAARAVFEKAQELPGEGEQLEEKEKLLARSMAMVDIAQRRGVDVDTYLVENVENALRGTSPMERAKALFGGRSYELAKTVLDSHKEISDNPSQTRRFGYLCLAGQDISPSAFDPSRDKFQETLDLMGRQQYPEALDLLNRTRTKLVDALKGAIPEGASLYDAKVLEKLQEQTTGIDLLRFDCEMNIALGKANEHMRMSDYQKALEQFEIARSHQDRLPDKRFVVTYETGDLDQRITEASALARTDQKATMNLGELSEAMGGSETVDRRKILATIEEAFRTTNHHEAVFARVQQFVDRVLLTGDVQLAREMIDRIPVSPLPDDLLKLRIWTEEQRVKVAAEAQRFVSGEASEEVGAGTTFETLDDLVMSLGNEKNVVSPVLQKMIGNMVLQSCKKFASQFNRKGLRKEARNVLSNAQKYYELVVGGRVQDKMFEEALMDLDRALLEMRKAAKEKGVGD